MTRANGPTTANGTAPPSTGTTAATSKRKAAAAAAEEEKKASASSTSATKEATDAKNDVSSSGNVDSAPATVPAAPAAPPAAAPASAAKKTVAVTSAPAAPAAATTAAAEKKQPYDPDDGHPDWVGPYIPETAAHASIMTAGIPVPKERKRLLPKDLSEFVKKTDVEAICQLLFLYVNNRAPGHTNNFGDVASTKPSPALNQAIEAHVVGGQVQRGIVPPWLPAGSGPFTQSTLLPGFPGGAGAAADGLRGGGSARREQEKTRKWPWVTALKDPVLVRTDAKDPKPTGPTSSSFATTAANADVSMSPGGPQAGSGSSVKGSPTAMSISKEGSPTVMPVQGGSSNAPSLPPLLVPADEQYTREREILLREVVFGYTSAGFHVGDQNLAFFAAARGSIQGINGGLTNASTVRSYLEKHGCKSYQYYSNQWAGSGVYGSAAVRAMSAGRDGRDEAGDSASNLSAGGRGLLDDERAASVWTARGRCGVVLHCASRSWTHLFSDRAAGSA